MPPPASAEQGACARGPAPRPPPPPFDLAETLGLEVGIFPLVLGWSRVNIARKVSVVRSALSQSFGYRKQALLEDFWDLCLLAGWRPLSGMYKRQ